MSTFVRMTDRERAIRAVLAMLRQPGNTTVGVMETHAARIADNMIAEGLLADESGPGRYRMENQPRAELVRRVRALHDEAAEFMQILAALDPTQFPFGDGRHCDVFRRDTGQHTPVSLARHVAALVERLREGKT